MFYRQHCAYDVNSAQKLFRLSCWPAGSATTFGASSALKSAVKLSPTEFRAMKVASGAHFLDAAHPCPSQKLSQIMSNHSAYSTLSDFIWFYLITWFYLILSCQIPQMLPDFIWFSPVGMLHHVAATKDDAPQVIHQGEHKKTISCMRDWAGGLDTSSIVQPCEVQMFCTKWSRWIYEFIWNLIKFYQTIYDSTLY